MTRRCYFLVCFDGNQNTLDDFSSTEVITAIGTSESRVSLSLGDRFILFDRSSDSLVGHGKVLNSPHLPNRINRVLYSLEFRGQVTQKRNDPLYLPDSGLEFLQMPRKKTLLNWKNQIATRISEKEFDSVFYDWWGIKCFSRELKH